MVELEQAVEHLLAGSFGDEAADTLYRKQHLLRKRRPRPYRSPEFIAERPENPNAAPPAAPRRWLQRY